MINYFCKPKLKVGTEWVNKVIIPTFSQNTKYKIETETPTLLKQGSTCSAASNSVAGIARAIYERTFR